MKTARPPKRSRGLQGGSEQHKDSYLPEDKLTEDDLNSILLQENYHT
jgi:hypothetical protein